MGPLPSFVAPQPTVESSFTNAAPPRAVRGIARGDCVPVLFEGNVEGRKHPCEWLNQRVTWICTFSGALLGLVCSWVGALWQVGMGWFYVLQTHTQTIGHNRTHTRTYVRTVSHVEGSLIQISTKYTAISNGQQIHLHLKISTDVRRLYRDVADGFADNYYSNYRGGRRLPLRRCQNDARHVRAKPYRRSL